MLVKKASKLNDKNIEVFTFGQFIGKSVKHILQTNPDYIKWIKLKTRNLFSPEIEKEIKRIKLI
ncbi:MAG: hypothetical protein M0R17_04375 [Candidatus Omnitrophica bacterium]|jgi:hypothetical protein|nr:hypothetical protein [Candidatus Omnitrophota bacterium]